MSNKMNWTLERVQNFWNYQSRRPELYFTFQFGGIMIRKFKKYLKSEQRILDFGCGPGFFIGHILAHYETCKGRAQVYGADVSLDSLQQVSSKYKTHPNFMDVIYLDDSFNELKNSFDVIFLIETVEHLEDPMLSNVLNQVKEYLKLGGLLIITTPNNENLDLSTIYCPACDCEFHQWQHVQSWNSKSITDMLSRQSFSIESVWATDFSFDSRSLKSILKRAIQFFRMRSVRPHLAVIAKKA